MHSGAPVGDLDEIGEFGLGLAPKDARPINKIELSKAKEEEIARMQEESEEERDDLDEIDEEEEKKMEIIKLKKQQEKKRPPIDHQTAFLEFKQIDGKEIEDKII